MPHPSELAPHKRQNTLTAVAGTYNPDTSRKISRLPAYMEIIREGERRRRVHQGGGLAAADRWLEWTRRCSCRLGRALSKRLSWRKKASQERRRVPTQEELVAEGKALCREYVGHRLRRCGVLPERHRHSLTLLASSEASQELRLVGEQLEAMYPDLFKHVNRQLNISMTTEEIVRKTFASFAERLCHDGIHWGKVVALFVMAGAFAEDCVRQGRFELVGKVVDSFGSFVGGEMVDWLTRQGGWVIPEVTRRSRDQSDGAKFWLAASLIIFACFATTLTVSMLVAASH